VARLTREEAAAYWQGRHSASDPWRAGGDHGLSEKANQAFYHLRLGLILRLLVAHFGHDGGQRILDAGCGRGWLTGHLRALGYEVTGIDQSEAAIAYARKLYGDPFAVAALDDFTPQGQFDAVISMDVLYHITDDEQWERSIGNLARAVSPQGVLLFSDCMGDETQVLGDYVVFRSRSVQERVLSALSLRIIAAEPYQVFSSASFYLCARLGGAGA
jgi:2-polyprenyl-3-methyl-5-hydroxy-6-metoxy-1,4-benzoquinol methylase